LLYKGKLKNILKVLEKEENNEDAFDWGDSQAILASLLIQKPLVELESKEESLNQDGRSVENMPACTRKKRHISPTLGMIGGLRAGGDTSY